LQGEGIPIVFCTSKTFAESVHLQEAMGIRAPLIVENGGAIYFRPGQLDPTGLDIQTIGDWQRISLGVPYGALLALLAAIEKLTGIEIGHFSSMSPDEIARECGLTLEAAERAKAREFDEPFRILSGHPEDLDQVTRMVEGVGLAICRGGRYHHLSGRADKGRAVQQVCGFLAQPHGPIHSMGIGDSPNDLPMLQAVEIPVVVMRPEGVYHPQLLRGVPGAIRATGVGPIGWNAAVLELLASGRW
jgi:mannosyl-3-phosphoglycerate phosphatase